MPFFLAPSTPTKLPAFWNGDTPPAKCDDSSAPSPEHDTKDDSSEPEEASKEAESQNASSAKSDSSSSEKSPPPKKTKKKKNDSKTTKKKKDSKKKQKRRKEKSSSSGGSGSKSSSSVAPLPTGAMGRCKECNEPVFVGQKLAKDIFAHNVCYNTRRSLKACMSGAAFAELMKLKKDDGRKYAKQIIKLRKPEGESYRVKRSKLAVAEVSKTLANVKKTKSGERKQMWKCYPKDLYQQFLTFAGAC